MKRTFIATLCALVCSFMLIIPAYATDGSALKTELKVKFPYVGTQFEVHKVATVNSAEQFEKTEAFRNCPVDLGKPQSGLATAQASVVESYVHLWEIEPTVSCAVESTGYAVFTGLDSGLYLVISNYITSDGSTYRAQPLLICLPVNSEQNNSLIYDVTISPKPVVVPPSSENTISQKVLKIWDHKTNETNQPTYVIVHLLCDGKLYDTQFLNNTNQWGYEWNHLEPNHVWSIVEEPVENYSVSVENGGITFVITNTWSPKESPTPTPSPSPSAPTTPTLPQTGMNWWLVTAFAAAGIILFTIGWLVYRRDEDET